MKSTFPLILILGLGLAGGLLAYRSSLQGDIAPPPIPSDPELSKVVLVSARRFALDTPYQHAWRAERPQVRSGYLLVLEVDRDLVFPRQTEEPVLYVGNQIAERVNRGDESGRLVVLVPGDLPLASAPIFFGPPGLPEELGAAEIERALQDAAERGVKPPGAARVEEVTGAEIRVASYGDLRRVAADLVEQYSPQEEDLVRGLRAPRIAGR
ncbi:MAG: hypothetical protein V2A76_05370 [Planctomycetota bacterium]